MGMRCALCRDVVSVSGWWRVKGCKLKGPSLVSGCFAQLVQGIGVQTGDTERVAMAIPCSSLHCRVLLLQLQLPCIFSICAAARGS